MCQVYSLQGQIFCVVNCALLQLVLLAAVLGGAAAADTVIVIETRRHAPLS